MGMAAGQARLLSITSRMSDNELRAQIINNNKMRLATESSQASEAYITALNQAQYMFTNYDANNNASFQPLTFNALTAYNPYNNQYGLVNSSGQLLVSEKDAANFQISKNLADFLKCYGLEEDTTYFDVLPTDKVDEKGNYDKSGHVLYTYYGDDGQVYTASTGFTPEELKAAYFGEHDTIKTLEQIGGTVDVSNCGYDKVLNGVDMYEYMTALGVYLQKKDAYETLVDDVLTRKLDELVRSSSGGKFSGIDALIKGLQNGNFTTQKEINDFYNDYLHKLVCSGDCYLSSDASELYQLATDDGKRYLYDLEDKFSVPSCHNSQYHNDLNIINKRWDINTGNIKVETNTVKVITGTNKDDGTYITEDRSTITGYSIEYSPGGLAYKIKVHWDKDGNLGYPDPNNSSKRIVVTTDEVTDDDNKDRTVSINQNPTDPIAAPTGYKRYEITEEWKEEDSNGNVTVKSRVTGVEVPNLSDYLKGSATETVQVLNSDGSASTMTIPVSTDADNLFNTEGEEKKYRIAKTWYNIPDTIENKITDGINLLNGLKGSLRTILDPTDPKLIDSNLDTTNAFQEYVDAANILYKKIYGIEVDYKTQNPMPKVPIECLEDISDLYNRQVEEYNGQPAYGEVFCSTMRPVFMNIILDNVMDTYGEPKITWINKDDPNDNSMKRAEWYTNLYNKMTQCGYHVLKDGLAASSEWIKFAFESGIVTMEQVDSYNAWNQLIYTNCSDITEQTNDKAVTIAEAEYNAAMNKIENKDKRYDLELKNIDTEHNSLQVEYDSIKAAIDKNIERNFKYLS